MDKKELARWLIVPIALILVIVLLMQISLSDLVSAFQSISLRFLVFSFALYVLLYLLRTARFRLMLKNKASYGTMFNIVCLHNLANSIMPFKTGELAFVYLSKMRLNLQASIGMVTVAIARMFDALAVCGLFMLALIMANGNLGILSEAEPVVLILASMLIVCIVLTIWYSRPLLELVNRLSQIKFLAFLPLAYIKKELEKVVDFYSSPESKGSVLPIFGLSILIWVVASLSTCALVLGMNLGVSVWAIIIGTLITVMFSALPIHGIGSLGTNELAWAAAFVALGVTKDAAISSGFAVHIIMLLFTAMMGVCAVLSDRFLSSKEAKAEM